MTSARPLTVPSMIISSNSTRVIYWEGSVAVRGSLQGQAKEGVGYVDLIGDMQQVNL